MSLRDIFGNLSEYKKIFKDNDDNDLGFDPAKADENGDPEVNKSKKIGARTKKVWALIFCPF